jgi:hypothetical protein
MIASSIELPDLGSEKTKKLGFALTVDDSKAGAGSALGSAVTEILR